MPSETRVTAPSDYEILSEAVEKNLAAEAQRLPRVNLYAD